MNKHYFYADDWDLMKKLMRKGVRLYCEEQGLSNDKDFRIVSLSTKGDWGHILNFSRCCDYPLNQDRKWEPFDAYYGKVYCDEEEIKNIIPKTDDKLKELLKQIKDSGIDSKTIINALSNKNESMDIKEAKQILNDAGFILESSQYDYEYELLKQYFPDAKGAKIQRNRTIKRGNFMLLYGWECEFYLNGKRHWFSFGKGGFGFEPSLKAYIKKYCKLDSFDDYLEFKKEYPDATLEDIREISKMG